MVENGSECDGRLPVVECIHHEILAGDPDFERIAGIFSRDTGTVVLLSGGRHDCSKYHILAADPWLSVSGNGEQLRLRCLEKEMPLTGDPFAIVDHLVAKFQTTDPVPDIPVSAGLFGYFAYDLKDRIEKLPRTCMETGLPDFCLYAPSFILVHDREKGRTGFVIPCINTGETGWNREVYIEKVRQRFFGRLHTGCYRKGDFFIDRSGLQSTFSKEAYVASVNKVIAYLKAGDIYQANLSQRFETGFSGDSYALFTDLYRKNPAPFFAFINAGSHHIVSTSPERFIRRQGEKIETRPIKGTAPRGGSEEADRKNARALASSIKDDAELTMIVDLMRNDLSRVAKSGTVSVKEHKRLEPYDNVFHLVSVVEAALGEDKSSVDFLKAAFPGGSITGCPKIRAMEIIDELEPVKRHVYTGSIGYISFHDTLDLSIAIRTATVHNNRLVFSVGGGIVSDSDPDKEFQETLDKGKTIMEALSHRACDMSGPSAKAWINGRIVDREDAAVSAAGPGFQYGAGVFETVRVEKGKIIRFVDHIKRLNRSFEILFGQSPPDITWKDVINTLIRCNRLGSETAAVKLIASKTQADAGLPYNACVFADRYVHRLERLGKSGIDLVTYPYPRQTPAADHKSLNYLYYYLAGEWARRNGGDEALIMNPDKSVSETNSCSLMIFNGESAVVPVSEHVLSGVTQKAVLDALAKEGVEIIRKKVYYAELCRSADVVLTNALMGAVPVASIAGKTLSCSQERMDRLNRYLK